MISKEKISIDWINQFSKQNRKADKILVEKVIRALLLLEDLEIIKTAFSTFATTELTYRNTEGLSKKDVLDDIFQTSLCIVTRGTDEKGEFEQLQLGIRRIGGFIFSESYHLEKAIIHASKAAYIASLILNDAGTIEKYENPKLLKEWKIGEKMNNKLNKLKKSNPEAFFYWYKIYELTSQEK